jgi:hypothetical protein
MLENGREIEFQNTFYILTFPPFFVLIKPVTTLKEVVRLGQARLWQG